MNTTTHRKTRRVAGGTAITVLLAAMSASASAEPVQAYRMMAIQNSAQGELVTSGRYAEAIDRLAPEASRARSSFNAQNNLCVAYAKTHALYKAVIACEAALDVRAPLASRAYMYSGVLAQKQRDRAIALSNRGVLRAVMGDVEGAHEDFQEARRLDMELDIPVENLAKLKSQRELTAAAR